MFSDAFASSLSSSMYMGILCPKGIESKLSLRLEDFESTTTSRKSVGGRSERERRGAVM